MFQKRHDSRRIGAGGCPADDGHTDGDGLAVGDGKMALCLHAVTDGVTQIQLHPRAGVEFVLHDHVPL